MVLHYTAMQSCAAALQRLCDPAAEVSAHYLIDLDGKILPLVPEEKRAWHAGAGSWGGRDDVNSRSIGVELANTGAHPFPQAQMIALQALLPGIMARWSIAPAGIIAHSDMAPTRKADPGPRFDWRRLARAGLSIWPTGTVPRPTADFARTACLFGYPDLGADAILPAFRLRFRPWASGPLDATDAGMMAALARAYPAS